MGLDQRAYVLFPEEADTREIGNEVWGIGIFEWRKHPNLHGWMEALYRAKGGTGDFNCCSVRLELSDLEALAADIAADRLPHTTGFFFGRTRPEEKDDDLLFIRLGREAIAAGRVLFYTADW